MQGAALDARGISKISRFPVTFLALTALAARAAAQPGSFEGHWANPKKSMVVNVSRCGEGYCAIVVQASAKAQANARKGGTEHFIGTEILRVHESGDGRYKGSAFDPESNMHVPATVRFVDSGTIEIQGCALLVICKTQRWTKVD